MKRLYLSPEEKASLEEAHQLCENRKEGDRIKAISLRSEGWTVPQISQALRLHQSTIIKHIEAYKTTKKLRIGNNLDGRINDNFQILKT